MSSSNPAWEVLVVDDEPDVLQVTKLALKNINVYGRPLSLTCLESRAEAEAYLKKGTVLPSVAVALIDVVMETDDAGLQLCRYIREELKNNATSIYVRTGQPGKAPEREVIDRYDISGYLHKVDLTEDKLYSVVKCAIRDFFTRQVTMNIVQGLTNIIAQAPSNTSFADAMRGLFSGPMTATHDGKQAAVGGAAAGMSVFVGDDYIGAPEQEAAARKAKGQAGSVKPTFKSERMNSEYRFVNDAHIYTCGALTQIVIGQSQEGVSPDFHYMILESSLPAFNALYELSCQKEALVGA